MDASCAWVVSLGVTHSQYWWTSSGVRSSGCFVLGVGTSVSCGFWHFGVGIYSFGGLGGGSCARRDFGLIPTGCGCVGLFLGVKTVVFISGIFSSIGAILTELQAFSCFWAFLALVRGILDFTREILDSTPDNSGLSVD